MKFFLDNNLPPRWAPALNALADPGQYEVEHLRSKFANDTPDVEWISSLSNESDWTIVSGDTRITKLRHEREAWLNSGLTAFFLVKGWNSDKTDLWEMTSRIVRWWPEILKQTSMVEPGAGFFVPFNFKNGKFEQVPLSRTDR